MKYNKSELIERAKEASFVETYEYVGKNHSIHTDTVKYIGNSNFDNSEIDALPFDEKGEVDADVELMDREDYERTILANCSSTWDDMYADGDKVLVIVVRKGDIMNEHNEDFAEHCAGIVAAYNGDEAMRKKYPHWENQYRQLKKLFTKTN